MDFALSVKQTETRDSCRQFAEEVITPRAEELDKAEDYPYQIMDKMADRGMMGIPFREEWGGGGGDWVSLNLCIEEISKGDIGLGLMLDITVLCAHELEQFGSDEQKRRWLMPLVCGKKIGSFGLTEPQAGSDAKSIRCKATRYGNEWVINGRKELITNIGLTNSSIIIIAAVSGKDEQGKNITDTFVVPKDIPGLTVGKKYDKIGLRSCATNPVAFADCRVPGNYLVGTAGYGLEQHLAMTQVGRIGVAAGCVGLAQACLDASLFYARRRVQFGSPIIRFEGISFKLADMALGIEAARLMYLKAAWLKDSGLSYRFESSAAKLYASEMVEKVASDAVQIHGGYGYTSEFAVSRYYRQAKVMQAALGTSEIQRIIITQGL